MTTTAANTDPRAALDQAALHLYDAECALHVARQSRVDKWINAAADHLHLAVLELNAAEHALSAVLSGDVATSPA